MRNFLVPLVLLILITGCANRTSSEAQAQASISQPDFAQMEKAGWLHSPLTGRQAPEFALINDDLEFVRLSELRGSWVVLYFYPADDTPGCTCQATDFTTQLQAFQDLNVKVLGVSSNTPQQHKNFRNKYNLKITLLSDPEGQVCRQFGAWVETTMDGAQYRHVVRSTFVIDPHGVIRRHWPEVLPEGHVARVREYIDSEQMNDAAQATARAAQ